MKSEKFEKYAEFYNLMYNDRNYMAEAGFIHELIRTFKPSSATNGLQMIDLGCGTAQHLIEFEKKGYQVAGTDISPQMIEQAKLNVARASVNCSLFTYAFQDLRKIELQYDVAISLFTAFGYLLTFEEQDKAIKGIYNLLANNGLFIFDIWNGHAVTQDRNLVKILRKKADDVELIRFSETKLDLIKQEATVDFTWQYYQGDRRIHEFTEKQVLHFFYISEIKNLLAANNFEVLLVCPFMDGQTSIRTADSNISIVARKRHN